MKKILILSILIFTVVFGISAEADKFPTIAIMDVAATNTSEVKSQVIYEYIVDVINRANRYTIVERSALQAALKEMEISTSGMVDDSTAAAIGKLAGAKLILISNLIVDDGITYLAARIVAVETGQVNETAMLQMEEGEYIASLANRTISELLGEEAEKITAETEPVKNEAAVVSESPQKSVLKDESTDSDQADLAGNLEKQSRVSMTLGVFGIIPFLGNEDIFQTGYGLNFDFDFNVLTGSSSVLSLGAGTGVFYDPTKPEGEVLYPFDMISIPLSLNLKYKLVLGRLYFKLKAGVGATYSIFSYNSTIPPDVSSTLTSLNVAVFPGISAGYMINDNLGLALFGDWSMILFTSRPFAALNAGLAVDIKL